MKKRLVKTTVKDGWLLRDGKTGRLVAVSTLNGTKKTSAASEHAVKEASQKRVSALKRLADR